MKRIHSKHPLLVTSSFAVLCVILSVGATACKKKSPTEGLSDNTGSAHSDAHPADPMRAGQAAVEKAKQTAEAHSLAGGTPGAEALGETKDAAVPNCFQVAFERKDKTLSEEAVSQHRNLIVLKHDDYEQKSLCVRVDGKPVRYRVDKKDLKSVMIGPVAGPQSTITARYCLKGGPVCKDECKVPKDEFLSAIGGDDDDMAVGAPAREIAHYGQWDESGKDKAIDVTAKLDETLRRELRDAEEFSADLKLHRDWNVGAETSSCLGKKSAKEHG